MKTYLNRKETEDALLLFGAAEEISHIAGEWVARGNLSPEEARGLAEAESQLRQSLELLCGRLDTATKKKLLNAGRQYRLAVLPKPGPDWRKQAEEELGPGGLYCSEDTFCALAECALENRCSPCSCPENVEGCEIRALFLQLDLPMFDENPPPGRCPWAVSLPNADCRGCQAKSPQRCACCRRNKGMKDNYKGKDAALCEGGKGE